MIPKDGTDRGVLIILKRIINKASGFESPLCLSSIVGYIETDVGYPKVEAEEQAQKMIEKFHKENPGLDQYVFLLILSI